MNVLMIASECVPLIKTGGLADVVGALPFALARHGWNARVLVPCYPAVSDALREAVAVHAFSDLFGGEARILLGRTPSGLEVLALDAPHLYDRPGNPYLGPNGRDWPDNHLRFAALCFAGARYAELQPDGWAVDLVHGHDWQAGLTPLYLADPARLPTVFTIHNIAFPGIFPASVAPALALPPEAFTADGYEYYGQVSFLKAGLTLSDRLTTVSPTYALELQTPGFGMGFDGLLRYRSGDLSGILNGVDETIWNPGTDPLIAHSYAPSSLDGKRRNRGDLQRAMGLDPDPEAFLTCVVSRLTDQKGLDLLLGALPDLMADGGQVALLGTGDPSLEAAFSTAAVQFPGRVGVRIGYDEPLSHVLIAGADAILVPSRFEPCGLTQFYGLRYGTIPVVARTGGLADSIIDANQAALEAGVATGIVFSPIDAGGVRDGLRRAAALFADKPIWNRMVQNALRHPVGWERSAAQYDAVYRSALGIRAIDAS
ncbi:glycogen synthase GlgA [Microvirga pudoricolor]|uniref:glycogen synthase GlgA n=1 Tax=Microvirga pudoricolor TaxID=2778729 RepID=UPI00194F5DED|nr:glycogen synthase GlgA [Microvirga pudoricolor]MBM6593645.1 glycogen synthase GlgA [Microvirga pudoricolor]